MNFFLNTLKSITSRSFHGSPIISRPPSLSPFTKTPPPSIFSGISSGSVRSFITEKKNSTGPDSYQLTPLPLNYGIQIVPEKKAYVVERFGKFIQVLNPGIHFLLPVVYKINYVHSMKEQVIPNSTQAAITKDNVPVEIDGVLYVKIIDAEKASYGVEGPVYAVVQLAQTVMRSELGKITLDKTFEERVLLNKNINVDSINDRPLQRD